MGKAASTKSATSCTIPEDDGFVDLIDEVSNEIDHEYPPGKHPNTTPKHHNNQIPGYVTPIRSIKRLYTYQAQIGRGVSGAVFLAQSNTTHKHYALKTMSRSDPLNRLSFINEINVLTQINHPNIVQFNDAYISDYQYFITTQYCSGGTLLERIAKLKRFSEKDCVQHMKKILAAVAHLHSKNIVHRDLKLANIVFDHDDIDRSKLKLIDFGQSEVITNMDKSDRNIVGSLPFLPPETVERRTKRNLFAGDMWSIGIIAYILIEGTVPYKARNVDSMMRCIGRHRLRWSEHISDSCKDFIHCLLNKDMNKRLNVEEALEHPWIVSKASEDDLGDEYFIKLQELNYQNKLQRIMVNAALSGMDETDKMLILSHEGYEDDNQLINQILSGTTPPAASSSQSQLLPKNYRLKVPNSPQTPKYTLDMSDKSLYDMNVDVLLDEIDADSLFSKSLSPRSPSMKDTMSMERFVEILQSSSKSYDIPQIIANVSNDGSEPITFERIASYHQRIDSLLL